MSRASPLRLVVVLAMAWAQTYPTINLMTEDALGDFAEEDWEGLAAVASGRALISSDCL